MATLGDIKVVISMADLDMLRDHLTTEMDRLFTTGELMRGVNWGAAAPKPYRARPVPDDAQSEPSVRRAICLTGVPKW